MLGPVPTLPTRFARLRRPRDRQGPMLPTPVARLRRARDRQGATLPTRFARLRRPRDRQGATRGPDPTAPLWRAAQVFRLLRWLYAMYFQIAINSQLQLPGPGWVLFGVLILWSAACALQYWRGFGRRPAWVIAEILIVVLLMWSNRVVATTQWASENQTWPTTLWATNPTISAALQFGPVGGMLTGLAVIMTNYAVKNYFPLNLAHNATGIIELSIGLAIGMAA